MRLPRDFASLLILARIAISMREARNRTRPYDREIDDA